MASDLLSSDVTVFYLSSPAEGLITGQDRYIRTQVAAGNKVGRTLGELAARCPCEGTGFSEHAMCLC